MNDLQRKPVWTVLLCAVTALGAAWIAAGCATKIVMEPTRFALGRSVDVETGALQGERNVFKANDEQVVAWVQFKNAAGRSTVRFKWYNDEEELVLDSGPQRVVPDDQLYTWRRAWSVLPVKDAPASLMRGDWRVDIYFNDKRVKKLGFDID